MLSVGLSIVVSWVGSWILPVLAGMEWLWMRKGTAAGKSAIVVTLLIGCLTLWTAFTGDDSAVKANTLARWTANKDFYEFCESVSTQARPN